MSMKERLKKLFEDYDPTVGCYVLAGAMLMIAVVHLATGQCLEAFNSLLFVIVTMCMAGMIRRGRVLKAIIVVQHKMIEHLDDELKAAKFQDRSCTECDNYPLCVEHYHIDEHHKPCKDFHDSNDDLPSK